MNGTATTCSSATASGCSAHTSSTAAATRRWGPPGATSTSRRSAVRRLGTRQRVTPRPRRTSGGTGTTTTTPRPRWPEVGQGVRRWRSRLPKARRRGESELKKGDHFAAFEQPGLSSQELRECSAESAELVLRSTDPRFCAKSQLSRFAVWKARKDAFWASGRQYGDYALAFPDSSERSLRYPAENS